MEERQVDVAIIGAGTAGLFALSEAKRQGLSWLLIEGGVGGTTCARVGCMPSKLLLNVAEHIHSVNQFSEMGLTGGERIYADPEAVMNYVQSMRDSFVKGVTSRTTDRMSDTHLLRGYARFTAPNTLMVDDKYRVTAKSVILATGSSPVIPDQWQTLGDAILTTDNLFEQSRLPKSMAIIGLGAIGLEIGQAMAQLGVDISGYDMSEYIGGITDPDINAEAIGHFNTVFPVTLGKGVELTLCEDGVKVETDGTSKVVEKVLMAAGRRPNLRSLNLEAAGVQLDSRGFPEFDESSMQIKGHPIFIAGDLSGSRAVMHEASDEGLMAGYNAGKTEPQRFIRKTPIGIVFTAPNIARIGQSYAELNPDSSIQINLPIETNGRARVKHQTTGSISLYADKGSGKLLGAELFCVDGEHLAHLLCWAIEQQITVSELVKMPAYHPVVEEGLMAVIEKLAHKLSPELTPAQSKLRFR